MDLEPSDLQKCDWPQDLDCRYDTKIYRGVAGKLSQSSIIYRQQPAAGDRVGSHAALQHCSTAAGHCTLQQCAVTVHADWGDIAQVMAWLYSKLEVSAIWITLFDLNFNERFMKFFNVFLFFQEEKGI